MTYAITAALQEAVYGRLSGDSGVQELVGSAVFDAVPSGVVPVTYVVVGEEVAVGRDDSSGSVARHDIVVSILSDAAGFATAKTVAVAVSDALDGVGDLVLSRGRVVDCRFRKARARRGGSTLTRQIDMTFRVLVECA
jgi:hypothetical protein